MKYSVGDEFPEVIFNWMDNKFDLQKAGTSELFDKKNIILIGMPGAFSPTCSIMHLPSFIENANKFGLAQLHQLRGRVGRGEKQATCVLLFKDGLSKNAIKRIKILKNSDDGFYIAEEDLKLRGFGDLIGYQQSGIKNFRFADPVIHEDLFKLAEKYVFSYEMNINQDKYSFLLKLFDRAEIINVDEI